MAFAMALAEYFGLAKAFFTKRKVFYAVFIRMNYRTNFTLKRLELSWL